MPMNAKNELSDPISLRMPQDLLRDLEKVAQVSQRTRSWIVVRALKRYMATEGADILEIAKGLEQAERGETVDFDDVIGEVDKLIGAGKAA
jgi:predicted transcriptional regulator